MAELVRHRSDLSDLHVFYAVAIHGGLNAAARALRVDPSTVTRTLDQLESRLNAKLVRRSPQGVTLTRAGEIIGTPEYIGGFSERVKNPRFATSVGLLLIGLEKHETDQAARIQGASFKQILERMKSWFHQNF